MNVPPLTFGVVVETDPDNYRIGVSLQGFAGGQIPGPIPVLVGTQGARDAVLGRFPELPRIGTHGVVAFPRGDLRNGTWICAISPALNDASSLSPGTSGLEWHSYFGGGAFWRGEDGTTWQQWPDGTTVLVGASAPSPTRHTVGEGQTRERTSFPLAERVAFPVNAFQLLFQHPSGAEARVDTNGAVFLSAAAGQTATFTANATTIVIDASGDVNVTAASGAKINLGDGGTLQSLLLAAAATVYNSHTHSDPQGGTTGVPNQQMTSADETTVVQAQ